MFFFKKLLGAILMPISIGLILALIGLYFLYSNRIKQAKIFLTASVIWLILMHTGFMAKTLLAPLESEYQRVDVAPHSYSHIVLLGGDVRGRAYEAIRLYHQLGEATIIVSGYAGNAMKSDAQKAKALLMESGIDVEHIIMQEEPKDTLQEAIAIKKRLGTTPFLLISNATHMGRAMALFKAQGLNPVAAPTNYLQETSVRNYPNAYAGHLNEIAAHEYIGRIYHWLKGEI